MSHEIGKDALFGFRDHAYLGAVELLQAAIDAIGNRAAERDKPDGERSMRRAVESFNALHGTTLSETQGWQFMAILKMARASTGKLRIDDYIDQAAYAALAAESAQIESLVRTFDPPECA